MSFVGYCCAREAVGNAEAVAAEIEPCRNRRRFISHPPAGRPGRWTLHHPLQPGQHDEATGCHLLGTKQSSEQDAPNAVIRFDLMISVVRGSPELAVRTCQGTLRGVDLHQANRRESASISG